MGIVYGLSLYIIGVLISTRLAFARRGAPDVIGLSGQGSTNYAYLSDYAQLLRLMRCPRSPQRT